MIFIIKIYKSTFYLGFKIMVKIVFRDVSLNMKEEKLMLVEDRRDKISLLTSYTMNDEEME